VAQAIIGCDLVAAMGGPEASTLEVLSSYSTVARVESMIPVHFVKEKFWSVSWPDRYVKQKMKSRRDKWSYDFKVEK
jgi:hypothetical protein